MYSSFELGDTQFTHIGIEYLITDESGKLIVGEDGIYKGSSYLREIIRSSEINNELLSMMYANNYDDFTNIIDKISLPLSKDKLAVLSKIGIFQATNEAPTKAYEYETVVGDGTLIPIKLPRYTYRITFGHIGPSDVEESSMSSGDVPDNVFIRDRVVDFSSNGGYNLDDLNSECLLMIYKSSKIESNISLEVHRYSSNPHKETDNTILRHSDINKVFRNDVIVNNFNTQSDTLMGDELNPVENIGDTNYSEGIFDEIGNRYIYIHNFNSHY